MINIDALNEFLKHSIGSNKISDYVLFLLLFLAGILIIRFFKYIILRRIRSWAKKTSFVALNFLTRLISRTIVPILYFGAFFFSIRTLSLHPAAIKTLNITGLVVLTFFGISFLVTLINYGLETYWVKKEKDPSKARSLKGIVTVINIFVWGLGVVLILDNLGFKVSAVLAGLGIGGVAVALAAQTILGDLFSYFAIFFDRPFEIGDFIIVGEYLGSVEHVGIKTTRIRSLGGEQIVFSNSDLTNSRVRNYKRMDKRRVVFKLGVTYGTSSNLLGEIPAIIKNIIEKVDDVVFDRAHFFSYGDFSLIFEIVYYVLSSDYNKYMDIQQKINLAIKEEFEKKGIEFAYPTQTLYVNKS